MALRPTRRCGLRAAGSAVLGVAVLAGYGADAAAQSPPLAPPTIAVGDWQLTPLVQIRTRAEYRRDPVDLGGADPVGGGGARVRDAWGVLERSRIGLGAEHGALRAQLTLQDARAWGAPPPTGLLASRTILGGIGAYEAFVEGRTSSARPAFLRVGRQAITWGDGRLLSNADWAPAARTLDAVRGHLPVGLLDFEIIAAVLDTPAPLGVSAGDTFGPSHGGTQLYGAQASWVVGPLLKLEVNALARIARNGQYANDLSTFSQARAEGETYVGALRVSGDSRGWKYALEGAYELGTVKGVAFGPTGKDRAAFALAAYGQKTFEQALFLPSVRVGGAYATGDSGGSTYRQFDPILADVHTLHGAMDVFAWSNLAEVSVRGAIAPVADTRLSLEYRYARLVESSGEWIGGYLGSIGSAPGNGKNELGHELDVVFGWRPWPALELVTGYSGLLLGDGARAILAAQQRGHLEPTGSFTPAAVAHTAYLQGTLTIP